MGISLSLKPADQELRQLAVGYCAMSGVDVLARRFKLALNIYIVCESEHKSMSISSIDK